jgi:hypothetical protein
MSTTGIAFEAEIGASSGRGISGRRPCFLWSDNGRLSNRFGNMLIYVHVEPSCYNICPTASNIYGELKVESEYLMDEILKARGGIASVR